MKKNIVIISKRAEIAEFILLEAKANNKNAVILPQMPKEPLVAELIFLDTETDVSGVNTNIPIIRFGKGGDIELPISISTLKKIFSEGVSQNPPVIDEDRLYFEDSKEKSVYYKGIRIFLTEGEWSLLLCLAEAKGQAVSRQRLMELFGAEGGNIVDVYICHLRKKLEEPFGIRLIRTVRGKGYALNQE